jgi:hypothetical protein
MDVRYYFRGKVLDKTDKAVKDGWAYGNYIKNLGWHSFPDLVPHAIYSCSDDGHSLILYRIDPTTLGQSTGKRDKNDRVIFEGDILDRHVVIWHEGAWHLKSHFDEAWHEVTGTYPLLYDYNVNDMEIIGNIYDNFELIKRANVSGISNS